MNPFGTPEFKVGALVLGVLGLIAMMSFKVAEGPGVFGRKKQYHFVVDNAGGLVKNSAVKMAGIQVGVIEDIVLENGRAKVKIALDPDAPITTSTRIELKAQGILGDKHVEITPGNPLDQRLESGQSIPMGEGANGLDDVMNEVNRLARSMNDLMDTLNKAAKTGDPESPVGRIILNLEKVSTDLADIVGDNKGKISDILYRLNKLTQNMNEHFDEEAFSNIKHALRNVEQITDKINRGEGTLGRLINDEETVEELNNAIANVNKFLGGVDKLETSIDFHSEYLSGVDLTKSFLGVRVQPGLDRYYEIQVIDDPRGVKRSVRSESTINGGATTVYEDTTTYKNKIKLTALFAKNFYDLTLKGGLIESSGGFGFDYYFLNRKLRFSAEFFELDDLYVRTFLRYDFIKGLYLIGGGDNLFRSDDQDPSLFFGAGIFITNDDLKSLASRISF